MRHSLLLFTMLGSLILSATPVSAQNGESRRLFESGQSALQAGRYAEARDRFRESLELTPRVATAFNLGVALRGTGETVEALATFDALAAGEYGSLSRGVQSELSSLREEVVAEIATVVLRVPAGATLTLFVDGRNRGEVQSGDEVPLDSGSHVLRAESNEQSTQSVTVELSRGARRTLRLRFDAPEPESMGRLSLTSDEGLVEIVGVGAAERSFERTLPVGDYEVRWIRGDETETQIVHLGEDGDSLSFGSASIAESPWFWLVIGAVVAGAVITTVVLTGDSGPTNDGPFGVTEALIRW